MTTSASKPFTEVVPSFTASRATGYVPPDATGTFDGDSPASTTTGRPHVPNPSTPAFINDFEWIQSYLVIHKMSTPSYRYSFMLWLLLVFVVLIFVILHWTGSRGGFIGAAWSKWALRRRTWRKKHALAQAKRVGKPHQQPFSFPSNAQLLSLFFLFIVPVALCVIGPDYIAPYTDIWDLTHNVTARSIDSRYVELDLQSRAVASTATTRSPEYTVPKAWWTAGGRTGIMAFALFPLVILFALKAPPFAVFAIPFLIQVHFDKLARLHRWTGRLIWFITTIHVFTWGVQLGMDKRGTGNRLYPDAPAWMFIWQYPLFIEGVIAYIALTALVILSLDSFRVKHYEAFYILHIILVPVTLVFAALHFPTIWWWCWSALFLWAGERIHRAIRWAFINGLLGKGKIPKGTIPMMPKVASPRLLEKRGALQNANGEPKQDWEQKGEAHNRMLYYDASYDPAIAGQYPQDSYGDFDYQSASNRYSSYSSREEAHKRFSSGTMNSNAELLRHYPPVPQSPPNSAHPLNQVPFTEGNPTPTYPPSVNGQSHGRYSRIPPPGFALAQLLPGRVVRLRLLTPRPIVWAPGQHVLLQVPDVSKYTTHPFTISGCYDDKSETGEGRVIELLVRAKNGFTKELWERVLELSRATGQADAEYPFAEAVFGSTVDLENGHSGVNGQHQQNTREKKKEARKSREVGGVLLRAYVDGPFGSSIRAHWGNHASVLIIVGGTGSSFGISILEYLSLCLAGRDGQTLGGRPGGWGHKGFKTTRVRFIWLIREFSHIQWCATIIRRCMELAPTGALQVDVFVSNAEFVKNNRNSVLTEPGVARDELLPPSAHFMRRDRSGSSSQESLASATSAANSMVDLSYMQQPNNSTDAFYGDFYHSHELGHEGHVLDYTNFDGEVDIKAPGEARINKRLHKEGKHRRAQSRRVAAAAAAKMELDQRVRQAMPGKTSPIPPVLDYPTHDRGVPRMTPRSERTSPSPGQMNLPLGASPPAMHPPSSFDPRYAVSAADQYRSPDALFSPVDQTGKQGQQSFAAMQAQIPGYQNQESNRLSVASLGDIYRGLSPSPVPGGDSIRGLVADGRPGSSGSRMPELEPRIEISDQEVEDIQVVSEMARPGKPKIDKILADEVGRARGAVAVACCGPASLNALVRKTVASQINPRQVLHGEMQGMITLITEEFQW